MRKPRGRSVSQRDALDLREVDAILRRVAANPATRTALEDVLRPLAEHGEDLLSLDMLLEDAEGYEGRFIEAARLLSPEELRALSYLYTGNADDKPATVAWGSSNGLSLPEAAERMGVNISAFSGFVTSGLRKLDDSRCSSLFYDLCIRHRV